LTSQASGVADLETKLRSLAAVYLESPQFVLAGIAPTEIGPKPRLRVCNGGACSYKEICEELAPYVEGLMYEISCNDASLVVKRVPSGGIVGNLYADVCKNAICTFEPLDVRLECASNPAECPRFPPICDPRCETGLECCGTPWFDEDPEGLIDVWAEDGIVDFATKTRILPASGTKWVQLTAGRELAAGDLIEMTTASKFAIELTDDGVFATPASGVPKNPHGGAWYVLVSGPSALPEIDKGPGTAPGELDWALVEGAWWMQNGDASRPPK
jgi:hypothetical protein